MPIQYESQPEKCLREIFAAIGKIQQQYQVIPSGLIAAVDEIWNHVRKTASSHWLLDALTDIRQEGVYECVHLLFPLRDIFPADPEVTIKKMWNALDSILSIPHSFLKLCLEYLTKLWKKADKTQAAIGLDIQKFYAQFSSKLSGLRLIFC